MTFARRRSAPAAEQDRDQAVPSSALAPVSDPVEAALVMAGLRQNLTEMAEEWERHARAIEDSEDADEVALAVAEVLDSRAARLRALLASTPDLVSSSAPSCVHVFPDGTACTMTWAAHHKVVGLAELHLGEPTIETVGTARSLR